MEDRLFRCVSLLLVSRFRHHQDQNQRKFDGYWRSDSIEMAIALSRVPSLWIEHSLFLILMVLSQQREVKKLCSDKMEKGLKNTKLTQLLPPTRWSISKFDRSIKRSVLLRTRQAKIIKPLKSFRSSGGLVLLQYQSRGFTIIENSSSFFTLIIRNLR